MSIAENRNALPFGAISTYRCVSAVEALMLTVSRAWRAAQTRRALARLSTHELADIGLADMTRSRTDLEAFAQALAARRG